MVGIDSLLQALGASDGDHSMAAQQLRAEIERLEQQDAELVEYGEQDEDEEEDMVRGQGEGGEEGEGRSEGKERREKGGVRGQGEGRREKG